MSPAQLSQFWRTTRHLHVSQMAWRVRRMADRLLESGLPRLRSQSGVDAELSPLNPPRPLPLGGRCEFDSQRLVTELAQGDLTLLNERKTLGIERIDWRTRMGPGDRLWSITLHYHAWLHALLAYADQDAHADGPMARGLARKYLTDWLRQCDPVVERSRSMAWNSYAIATRLGWWTRIIGLLHHSSDAADRALIHAMQASAARQAAHLHENLEWDLRANHLLRDCVGLMAAASMFRGQQAEAWRRTARQIAVEQAREQVLPDGGHFERSPMYHLETLEDFALICQLLPAESSARDELRSAIGRMIEFAAWMQHPDGRTPQFNDSVRRDVHATLAQVCRWVETDYPKMPSGFRHFADTGVACYQSADWSIFFDCGPVGPDYQPGHAHADTLSLEASCGGERLLIDPGVGRYDSGPERSYDRATSSHNTVAIDGVDSSEVWHIFRVGRRAYPLQVTSTATEGGLVASAAHNGYDHLPGRPRHSRQIELRHENELVISDTITGDGSHTVRGQWLLDPQWEVHALDQGWRITSPMQSTGLTIEAAHALQITLDRADCHFEFGHTCQTQRVGWRYDGELPLQVRTTFRRIQGD